MSLLLAAGLRVADGMASGPAERLIAAAVLAAATAVAESLGLGLVGLGTEPWALLLTWTVWLLRYPAFDFDNLAYRIPEVVAWVHNGRPGSLVSVVPGFPHANLPIIGRGGGRRGGSARGGRVVAAPGPRRGAG